MDLRTPAVVVRAPICPNLLNQEVQYTLEHVTRLFHGDCNLHPTIGASSKILLCEKDLSRLKRDMEEAPLTVIDNETFSCMLNTFEKLVQIQHPSIQVVESIKLICKILWSSIYIECPKPFLYENVLKEWMSLFLMVLERPVPVTLEGKPADIECRNLRQWLKIKKWVVKILNHLFTRFAINARSYNRDFAKIFEKNHGGEILECCLKSLQAHFDSVYLPDKLLIHILQYLTNSVLKISMYRLLQPRLMNVLFNFIFPLICFNNKDQKLWEEDSFGYVKNTGHSPKTAGIEFLNMVVRKHEKDTLHQIVNFLIEKIKSCDKNSEDIEEQRQKDGALLAFGTLSKRVVSVISHFELLDYLESYVLPEITNRGAVGHLRAKAVWVAGEFASDLVFSPRAFHVALNAVIIGMGDPELPVCCNSVIALRSFVQVCDRTYPRRCDTYSNALIPRLSELVNGVLGVMDKSVNTDLVYTIETIVETFPFENTAPYALQLCQNLADAFWNYMNIANGNGNEEVYNQAVSASLCCLRAILRTLEASSSNHHCEYFGIEPIVLPIMRRMLTTEGQEMYEEVLEIVSYMLAFQPSVSWDMWSLWPLIADAPVTWVIEFFTYISYVLQNYISKDTHNFLTFKELDCQQSLWNMISTIMGYKNLKDIDIEPAAKLLGTLFQNCRGQVDQWLEPYIRITVERLQRTERSSLKCLLLLVIGDALYYNAPLTLNILQNLGEVASEIFNLWLHMLLETQTNGRRANFKREQEKKICCLGLTSLLPLPGDQLPDGKTLELLYKANLDLLVAYKDQVEENAEESVDGEVVDVNEFDEEPDFELGGNYYRIDSPIDEVDPFILFEDTLKGMEASKVENLRVTLDSHFRSLADCLAEYTDKRRLHLIACA
jgi:hypothetical protein